MLQAGSSAGILTAPLFVALVVMALATTVLTGPLLPLLDTARGSARQQLRRRVLATAES